MPYVLTALRGFPWFDTVLKSRMDFWPPVPRLYEGQTVVCAASGPSLTSDDLDVVRQAGWPLLVTNSTWKDAPWASVLYGADRTWWNEDRPTAEQFVGLRVSPHEILCKDGYPGEPRIRRVLIDPRGTALSTKQTTVTSGKNSGFQTFNLAVLFGASRILLLGYDMGYGPKGEKHHHKDHGGTLRNPHRETFKNWIPYFNASVPILQTLGVAVVNCSRRTTLTCFARRPIIDVFHDTYRTQSEQRA